MFWVHTGAQSSERVTVYFYTIIIVLNDILRTTICRWNSSLNYVNNSTTVWAISIPQSSGLDQTSVVTERNKSSVMERRRRVDEFKNKSLRTRIVTLGRIDLLKSRWRVIVVHKMQHNCLSATFSDDHHLPWIQVETTSWRVISRLFTCRFGRVTVSYATTAF